MTKRSPTQNDPTLGERATSVPKMRRQRTIKPGQVVSGCRRSAYENECNVIVVKNPPRLLLICCAEVKMDRFAYINHLAPSKPTRVVRTHLLSLSGTSCTDEKSGASICFQSSTPGAKTLDESWNNLKEMDLRPNTTNELYVTVYGLWFKYD